MTESMSKCTFTERSGETFEDYTAVTDWEVFTQELENLLISWIIKEDIVSSTDCGRLYLCGNLKFGQRVFSLFYYKYKESGDEDKKSTNSAQPNDTQTSAHLITRIPDFNQPYLLPLFWFGLSHAFLLKPEVDWIKGGTRLSLLLSSVEMAVYSTRCPIPLLVEHYIQTYFGLVASSSLKSSNYAQNSEVNDNRINSLSSSSWIGSLNIDFSSCHFTDEISQNCTHLGGLKEIFLTKLGYPWSVNCAVPKLDIAARFIYHLPSCSSLQTDYSNTNLSIFSFDLFQESPLELSFNLATTWPSVPSHAITEKPSWKSLKPEGAPEWQLQMCSTSPFVDRMSKRIQRLLEPDHILSDKSSQPTDFSSDNNLSSSSVLQFLLFLFPDADSEGLCNKVLRSELTSPFTNPTSHELLFWNRKQLSYSDVKKLAAHFGLPNPCCLIHRLAVVIGNLFVYKNCDRSQLIPLIKSMFNELHIELKLRYDRLICLPSLSLYEEVYRNVSHSSETISSFLDDDGNDRPNLMPWNQSSMMSASELKFNDWPNDAFHSLDYVFNRFNACILKGSFVCFIPVEIIIYTPFCCLILLATPRELVVFFKNPFTFPVEHR
uniref:Rab3 GTPase-activating protein catalytic subunit n=1 Tax=Trichobilharzia regenti TaxID=157069 RepID=A0AA85JF99_TRIRE|nr:unnamed protein product [Trichobilharzia regenti]